MRLPVKPNQWRHQRPLSLHQSRNTPSSASMRLEPDKLKGFSFSQIVPPYRICVNKEQGRAGTVLTAGCWKKPLLQKGFSQISLFSCKKSKRSNPVAVCCVLRLLTERLNTKGDGGLGLRQRDRERDGRQQRRGHSGYTHVPHIDQSHMHYKRARGRKHLPNIWEGRLSNGNSRCRRACMFCRAVFVGSRLPRCLLFVKRCLLGRR